MSHPRHGRIPIPAIRDSIFSVSWLSSYDGAHDYRTFGVTDYELGDNTAMHAPSQADIMTHHSLHDSAFICCTYVTERNHGRITFSRGSHHNTILSPTWQFSFFLKYSNSILLKYTFDRLGVSRLFPSTKFSSHDGRG